MLMLMMTPSQTVQDELQKIYLVDVKLQRGVTPA